MSSNQPIVHNPQPAQPAQQRLISLLELAGEKGIEFIAPFADNIGNLVNGFAPGVGTQVASLIKAIAQAEAETKQSGLNQAGSAKLSRVLSAESANTAKTLAAHGRPSGTPDVTAVVNQAVETLRSLQVTAGPAPTSKVIQSPDPNHANQASQPAAPPKPAVHS